MLKGTSGFVLGTPYPPGKELSWQLGWTGEDCHTPGCFSRAASLVRPFDHSGA
jgi:hypothetical protein